MTELQLYFLLMLDNVRGLFVALNCVFILVLFGISLFSTIEDKWSELKGCCILFSSLLLFSSLATILVPATKEAMIIFGVPALIQQAKNTNADKIPGKVIDYFNEYLDKETKKLSERKQQ